MEGQDNTRNAFSYTNHGGTAANSICTRYMARFYPVSFNNFAARMDWAKDGVGNRNPIVAIDGNKGTEIVRKTLKPGSTVQIDASASSDPDGDSLTFKWWIQAEAVTYSDKYTLLNTNSSVATVVAPLDHSVGSSIHVICEVSDNRTHKLTSYRRIILE